MSNSVPPMQNQRSPKKPPVRRGNPMRDLFAVGRMPVILELHLTEADRIAYGVLRRRHIARGLELPNVAILGECMREMDPGDSALTSGESQMVKKLQTYGNLLGTGAVDMVALDDGSRGRDTLDNAVAAELLAGLGVDPARLLINMVARNRFPDQIRARLAHFAAMGVRNVLLLTGDLPVDRATPVRFPLDSIGMLELARDMQLDGALPDDFWLAAAGHPNPDADPDGMQALHKVLAGARVLITQAIYSVDQFREWMTCLQKLGVLDMAHVLAEVIPISSAKQLRSVAEVPGIRVPIELIQNLERRAGEVESEAVQHPNSDDWKKQQLRLKGVRVTRDMLHTLRGVPGVSGFYLGCLKSFELHLELLKETPLLPDQSEGLLKSRKLSGAERQRALAEVSSIESYIETRRQIIQKKACWFRRAGRWLSRNQTFRNVVKLLESPKIPIFGCKQCDHCDLSPDALVCPRGCAKQMSHGPCGAPRMVNGRMLCEDTSRECTWAKIRTRRGMYGVALADRLSWKPAPSPAFYEGRKLSAVLPVLEGARNGPNWSLAWRAPLAHVVQSFRDAFAFPASGSPTELLTLARAMARRLDLLIESKPTADTEEMLIKLLTLIGTPAAVHLIEVKLVELGLPAEGALADLSLRECFRVAEAIPIVRARLRAETGGATKANAAIRCEEILRAIPEGRELRQAVRRELAQGIIRHCSALGVDVTYSSNLLEGKQIDDFLAALTALKEELQLASAIRGETAQRLPVYFHRVHYKNHYHAPIAMQRFADRTGDSFDRPRLQIDMRQFGSMSAFRPALRNVLDRWVRRESESSGAILLEEYRPISQSVCWRFNVEFWKRLREFEQAMGVSYDASIGGSTDHNLAYARVAARALYDRIHQNVLESEELFVLEIGVASTFRARAFMNEYRRVCEVNGHANERQLTYLLADFSPAILQRGADELARENIKSETVLIDASDPFAALGKYRGRIIHTHLCNVFDNLPADQWVWSDDRWRRVEARAYISGATLRAVSAKHGLSADECEILEHELTMIGQNQSRTEPVAGLLDRVRDWLIEKGKSPLDYVHWWMEMFAAVKFDERHVPLDEGVSDSTRQVVDDELIRLHPTPGEAVRVHVNGDALRGFKQLLSVLHAKGTLEVIDLFVQRPEEYHHSFKGPAKYDGSTVNWLNGPMFRAVAESVGFSVRFQPFRPFDSKSPSVVLIAQRAESTG